MQQAKDPCCRCSSLSHCCGVGLIPDPGASIRSEHRKKQKECIRLICKKKTFYILTHALIHLIGNSNITFK